MKYFLYDVETTGFTRRDEVIQFSGYLLDDNLRNEHIINFYAYTQIESNPDALKVHHLDKKLLWELSQGKTFEEQIFQYEFLFDAKDITFVGYNIPFDNRLVNQTLKNNGYEPFSFGSKVTALTKSEGRHYFDLMSPMSSMFNHGIKMKLSDTIKQIKFKSLKEINEVYDVIFKNVGTPSGFSEDLAKQNEISKFHNSLYDSFIYWCLLLDYKTQINCMFR